MLRTQIYLPADQLKLLKKRAWEEEMSLSELIRKIIEEKWEEERISPKGKNVGDWLLSLANKAKKEKIKGPKDLATNLDEYLYGKK